MRALVAFPSTAIFGQQVALAFHEREALAAFMTTFAFRKGGFLDLVTGLGPARWKSKIDLQLHRRAISGLPDDVIVSRPFWEIIRTLADKAGFSAPQVDRIWDHLSHDFTRAAGRYLNAPDVGAIYAYEYTALEAFAAAERLGKARILDFPSLNSREFEEIQRLEKSRFPELKGAFEDYFADRFECRQARRDAEMAAADVIITNSSVTRRSHIAGGARPGKTFAVPYGAPPVVDCPLEHALTRPLKVIWAGTFSIRKGAHYLLDAWRTLGAERHAQLDVYGAVTIPERVWRPPPSGVNFHGSLPRPILFEALDNSDVLIFPSLSDGFGMVVTEAFARGLPVITTDRAGASDLVKDKVNGLVISAGDADAIAASLQWCLDNRQGLAAMRHEAWKTARDWQWADYRRALIAAVNEGLGRSGCPETFDNLVSTSDRSP